jgi:hypothetical protein
MIGMFWAKKHVALLVVAVLVLLTAGGWWRGYVFGKEVERSAQELRYVAVMERARQEQESMADALEIAKQSRRVVYRDRIQVVRELADSSGCADVDVPDSVRDALASRFGGG